MERVDPNSDRVGAPNRRASADIVITFLLFTSGGVIKKKIISNVLKIISNVILGIG